MHFWKLPPKIISYRHFKKFDKERFMDSSQHTLGQEYFDWSKNPDKFYEICHTMFNTHAPRKKKYIRGTHFRSKFGKILTIKTNYSITNKETIVLLFLEKRRKNTLQD